MKPKELKNTLIAMVNAKMPCLIKGAPGVGKSDIIAQVAEATKHHLIISHPVVSDPTDFKGQPWVVDGKATHLPYNELRQLVEAVEPTIYFLDDLGQAPACVQAAAMQLILARRVNGHKVSDSVVFIAATNRREDRAGVTGILEPVKSRFASIIQLDVSTEDWVEWAIKNDMPAELIGFIYFRPELLHKPAPTADIINSPCPRTIAYAGKLIKLGLTSVEVLAGAIGEGAAIELVGFLKIQKDLPDLNEILDKPKIAPIPNDPATLYAVVAGLVNKADSKNVNAIFTYACRLPGDMSVLLGRDLGKKDPTLFQCKAREEWSKKNGNILF